MTTAIANAVGAINITSPHIQPLQYHLGVSMSPIFNMTNTSSYNMTMDSLPSRLINGTDIRNGTKKRRKRRKSQSNKTLEVSLPLYFLIFVLAVAGNTLVIVTLIQNQRMWTVTNVFLLNLSVSDLLLAVFCMPFTLVPSILKNFIFGEVMCVLIRYSQGISIFVSVYTLVAISLERYFAICQPLKSRSWQTVSHSYKMIAAIWFVAFIVMIPLAVFHKLKKLRFGNRHKCLEVWPNHESEVAYTIVLDVLLLVIPCFIMLVAYGKIAFKLWSGIRMETKQVTELAEWSTGADQRRCLPLCEENEPGSPIDTKQSFDYQPAYNRKPQPKKFSSQTSEVMNVRRSNNEKSLAAKRRVIKMLFVVVLEFFICWTPMYVLYTWAVLDLVSARKRIPVLLFSLIQLLSYISACCNPITYCFMNKTFRQGFVMAFRCLCPRKFHRRQASEYSYGSPRTVHSSVRSVEP